MFEEFDSVLTDGGGGVCDVDDEAVGLAAHELCGDDDAFDPGGGVAHDDLSEVVVLFDADDAFHGIESEILDLEGVFTGCDLQFEPSVGVGGHSDDLLGSFEEYDRGVFDGLSLFVDDAPDGGAESCGVSRRGGHGKRYDQEDPLFHAA